MNKQRLYIISALCLVVASGFLIHKISSNKWDKSFAFLSGADLQKESDICLKDAGKCQTLLSNTARFIGSADTACQAHISSACEMIPILEKLRELAENKQENNKYSMSE